MLNHWLWKIINLGIFSSYENKNVKIICMQIKIWLYAPGYRYMDADYVTLISIYFLIIIYACKTLLEKSPKSGSEL